MMIDELRHALVIAGIGAKGASTSTASIFVESLPEWDGVSILLAQAQGQAGDRHFGNDVPAIERPQVDMLVRSTAPAGGAVPRSTGVRGIANAAYRVLTAIRNENVSTSTGTTGTRYLSVDSISGPPFLFDRDDRGRLYYRVLFQVQRMST